MQTAEQICVVIGASHGGVNLAFSLRREGWEGKIILFDSDPEFPYHRPPLSKAYLTSKDDTQQSLLFPKESYISDDITLRLGMTVSNIDADKKTIILSNGSEYAYDKLVIATGARPLIPPIKGIDTAKNLFPMRTAIDAMNIKKVVDTSNRKRVVVIGGGYIGLETAASLKKLGADVVVLEREDRVLARVTAPVMSTYFTSLHKSNGVEIYTNKNVISIEPVNDSNKIVCEDGSAYEADVIVVGVGILVNLELAEAIGIAVENGIKVDAHTRTSTEDIYAIGDCSYHYNPHYNTYIRLESVQNAVDQAKIAAKTICGQEVGYDTIPWFWSDQYDVKLQMVGLSNGYSDTVVRKEEGSESFSVWYFNDDSLLAVDAVNNARAYMLGTKLIKSGQRIDKSKLLDKSIPIKPKTFLIE